jgi:hypothetical protein
MAEHRWYQPAQEARSQIVTSRMWIPLGVCFAGADDRVLARVSAGAAQDTQRAARPPRGLRKVLPLKAPGPPANVAGAVASHGILGPHLAQCDL